jgi:DNA-directed RNA polymerase alpha subunit
MMDTINGHLPEPVNPEDERINGEEHFYKVVRNFVRDSLDELKELKKLSL